MVTHRSFILGRVTGRAQGLLMGVACTFGCTVYDSELLQQIRSANGGNTSVPGVGGSNSAGVGGQGSAASAGQAQGNAGIGSGSGSGTAGAVGSGGEAGSGGVSGGAAGTSAAGQGSVELELIDDMEDGNVFVRPLNKRDGHWDVGHDDTSGATQEPLAAHFAMRALADEPQPGDRFIAYTKGEGFESWGAFMTVAMRTWPDYNKTPTYDASLYSGISFYARIGDGSDETVRVRFIGANTDPRSGECTAGGSVEVACYDHFLQDIVLTPKFALYQLNFADFYQSGVGKQVPGIDLGRMYAIEFFFPGRPGGNDFELWVDDISFIKK